MFLDDDDDDDDKNYDNNNNMKSTLSKGPIHTHCLQVGIYWDGSRTGGSSAR